MAILKLGSTCRRREIHQTQRRPVPAPGRTALVALLVLGCTSPGPSEPPSRSLLSGSAAQSLLILPLNVTAVMATELESMSPYVWQQLEIYLRDQGKELKTVNFETARRMWIRSMKQVRAASGTDERVGFDAAAGELARALAKHADFDTLVIPSLFVRKARIQGRDAFWDGVERRLELETGDGVRELPVGIRLSGQAAAASLHVAALNAAGEKLHEAVGGLELLVRVAGPIGLLDEQRALEFVTRTDLFANPAQVREGIAVAFDPFLPKLLDPDGVVPL